MLLLHRSLLAGLAALVLLLAAASLSWPFSWDHGIFAWIGDTIVRGGMPYRDAWDVKGPLTFYAFAAVEWLGGAGMRGIRILDLLMLGLGAGAAARMARLLGGPGAGAYTFLVLAIQYIGTGYFETAQPDGWAGFLLLLGLVPLVRREDRTALGPAIGSAIALGTCLLLKPPYGIFALAPAAYLLLAPDLVTAAKLRALVVTGAAFLLPALVCAAWFAWRGALDELLETYVLFNLAQASVPLPGLDMSPGGALLRFGRRLVLDPVLPASALAAAVAVAATWRERPRAVKILLLTTVAAFFTVFVQQRYWNRYHWHGAYLTLGLLAGIGLGRLWHRPGGGRIAGARLLAAGLGAAIVVSSLPQPLHHARRWLELTAGRLTPAEYEAAFGHPTVSWTIATSRALAGYLRSRTAPNEAVLVWSDPLVNYLSERPSVGRLGFHVPFSAPVLTPLHHRYRDELLQELDRRPPRYIAVGRRHLEEADSLNEANIAHAFPALRDRLLERYAPVARFGEMELFERQPAAESR
ncbi:MAG TPA: hypothetical protein VFZ26_11220 [Gemmatimonadales bacterium]